MRARLAITLLAGLIAPAHAQQRTTYGNLGYCQMTSLAAAAKLITANCTTGKVPSSPVLAEICVSGAAIRYTSDGSTTPTASIGIPAAIGCFAFAGPIANLNIIQQAASATVDFEFFQ